jgi:hypothetical protein
MAGAVAVADDPVPPTDVSIGLDGSAPVYATIPPTVPLVPPVENEKLPALTSEAVAYL